MSRKGKVSKEIKIQACEDYIAGKGSLESIAKSIGLDESTFSSWY